MLEKGMFGENMPDLKGWIEDYTKEACSFELHQVEDLPGLSLHFLKAFDLLGEELAVYALTPNQALIVGGLLAGREIED